MLKSPDLADHSNTKHFGPSTGFFQLGFQTTISIWQPDTNLPFEYQTTPSFRWILYSNPHCAWYFQDRILEPCVAGTILASMCKSCVAVQPEMALEFFVPHFCQKISSIISERRAHPHQKSHQKIDQELQFALLLLSEVISIRGLQFITRYVFRLLFLGNCSPRTQVMLLHPFIHPSNLALFSHTKAACQIYETSLNKSCLCCVKNK